MPGIDTLNLHLPIEKIGNNNYLNYVPDLLTNQRNTTWKNTNLTNIIGNRENLLISVNERGFRLRGSIPKFCFNDNIHLLEFSRIKEAIEMLSDEFKLPLGDANIRRLDVAENFITNYPPSLYYSFLGDSRGYRRLEQNNGLRYQQGLKSNGKKAFTFYDKLQELKVNKLTIPKDYETENLLRYEFRLYNRLNEQLQESEITFSSLNTGHLQEKIINMWKDGYYKITKHKKMNIDFRNCVNAKDFETQLILAGIVSNGGEAVLLNMIKDANEQGIFRNKMQFKRIKDKINAICNTPNRTFESDAILELNEKVKESGIV